MPPKLLHTSLMGWGAMFGAPSTKATPVGLIGLPSAGAALSTPSGTLALMPASLTPAAATVKASSSSSNAAADENALQYHHRFVSIAAGTRHIAALTTEGNIIAMGNNRYGQVGQPVMSVAAPSFGDSAASAAASKKKSLLTSSSGAKTDVPAMATESEHLPFYYDLGYADVRRLNGNSQIDASNDENVPTHVVSGCNHNLFYRPGTTNVVAFGNNNVGQLGLGHKQLCLNTEGFAEWDRNVPWARPEDRASGLKEIVCGQMHTMIIFNSGAVYGCGSNLCGELGVGDVNVDGNPRLVLTDDVIVKRGTAMEDRTAIKQIACGMNFTLFLTKEGRVYGTGSSMSNQIPGSSKLAEPFPIHRGAFSLTEAANSAPSAAPVAFSNAPLGSSVSNALVRVKHIAACTELAVFVTSKNEVLLRGIFSDIGFASGSRFHVVMPLEEDRCANGRTMPHVHPEIVRVYAKESNVLITYADGRVVGVGSNTDGQVKMTSIAVMKGSGAEASVAVRGVGGSTAVADDIYGDESASQKRAINIEKGNFTAEVGLILPTPVISPSSAPLAKPIHEYLQVCHGLNFGFAIDTSPVSAYEEGLVQHYRRDREARRGRGEAIEKVLMTEVVFPPIPRELGLKVAPNTGPTYRRATRGSRVASGVSPAAVAAVAAASSAAAAASPSSEASSPAVTPAATAGAPAADASSVSGGSTGKVTMEDLIKRRRAKLKF